MASVNGTYCPRDGTHQCQGLALPVDDEKAYKDTEELLFGYVPILVLVDLSNGLTMSSDRNEHSTRTGELVDKRLRESRRSGANMNRVVRTSLGISCIPQTDFDKSRISFKH